MTTSTTRIPDVHAIAQFLSEDAAFQALTAYLPEDLAAEVDDMYQDGILVYEIARYLENKRLSHPERFPLPPPAAEVLVPKAGGRVAVYDTASCTFVADDLTREEYLARFAATYSGPYSLDQSRR